MYGPLWEHESLNPLTHNTLHELFGHLTAKLGKHIALTMRKRKLVSATGKDIYLPDVDKQDRLKSPAYRTHIRRLNIPICFIVGEYINYSRCKRGSRVTRNGSVISCNTADTGS